MLNATLASLAKRSASAAALHFATKKKWRMGFLDSA
jgi:hypothetical protein